MISDEPDEDADTLDDDTAIEVFLGDPAGKPDGAAAVANLIDWPPCADHDLGFDVDAATLAWFKSTYVDWRRQMRAVLRSWMDAHTPGPSGSRPAARVDEQP